MNEVPTNVSYWGDRKTLHIVLAVLTAGLWLLGLLAVYLWRKNRKGWAVATATALGLIVLAIGIGAATPTEETAAPSTDTTEEATTETETEAEAEATETPPPPASPRQRVRQAIGNEVDASGWAGTVDVQDVSFGGKEVQVILTTPEGGFQGASCGDLNEGAMATFVKVYGDAAWDGATVVVFKGGLVDTATGQPVPDVNTGIFTMPAAQARRINWADENALFNINWSLYRDFCHRALKQ